MTEYRDDHIADLKQGSMLSDAQFYLATFPPFPLSGVGVYPAAMLADSPQPKIRLTKPGIW